jgi:hypothetical protein
MHTLSINWGRNLENKLGTKIKPKKSMISRESKERKEKRNEACGESKAKQNKTKQNLEKLLIKKYIGN